MAVHPQLRSIVLSALGRPEQPREEDVLIKSLTVIGEDGAHTEFGACPADKFSRIFIEFVVFLTTEQRCPRSLNWKNTRQVITRLVYAGADDVPLLKALENADRIDIVWKPAAAS